MRIALLTLVAGCSSIFGLDSPQHAKNGDAAVADDDVRSDLGVDDNVDPDGAMGWGNVQLAFTSVTDDDDPTLTDDMLELFFNRGGDIYVTTRLLVTDPWGTPVVVPELSPATETTPEVFGDGLTIGVASDMTGTVGGADLWYTGRASRTSAWVTPLATVTNLNTVSNEANGPTTADIHQVAFSSNRAGGLGDSDIYWSSRTTGYFDPATLIPDLSSAASDYSPFIARDGSEIYFDSNRTGTARLFHSTRLGTTSWSVPQPITELDGAGDQEDPWVSADGHTIFFTSSRSGGRKIYWGNPVMRLALLMVVVGSVAGCSSLFGLDRPGRQSDAGGDGPIGPDDDAGDDAASDAGFAPWGNVTRVLTNNFADDDVTLTADMLEMYFNRADDIYVSKRATTAAAWPDGTLVTELMSPGMEATPDVSGDGLLMIFTSNRAPSMGYDIWFSTRGNRTSVWGTPQQFTMINSAAEEVSGPQTLDTLEIVYAADRLTMDDSDLYYSVRAQGGAVFGQGTRLPFNTTDSESSPFLTEDGQFLYFSRVISTNMTQLYVTRRLGATEWSTPESIDELNSAVPDSDPWVSPDGHTIYFCRWVQAKFQIFMATR